MKLEYIFYSTYSKVDDEMFDAAWRHLKNSIYSVEFEGFKFVNPVEIPRSLRLINFTIALFENLKLSIEE